MPDQSKSEMSFDETVAPDGLLSYKIDWSQIEKKEGKRRVFYIKLYDKKKNLLYKPYIDKPSAAFYTDPLGKVTLLAGSNLKFDESTPGMALVAIEDGGDETGICECEARIRAFMRMIRIGEGTTDEGGYTRIVGGSSFADHGKDMSDHPKVYIKKHNSTAAGAYQITKTNWNDLAFVNWRKAHNVNDFSKHSQDIYGAYLIIVKKKAFKLITELRIKEAIHKCRHEWASFPGSGYEQREEKIDTYLIEYQKFLDEELKDNTTLFVEKGFLRKTFYKTCNCRQSIKDGLKCSNCDSVHIDLADESKWLSQFDSNWKDWSKQPQNQACFDTAKQILRNYGLKEGSGNRGINNSGVIQTVKEENDSLILVKPQAGVNYLNEQLIKKNPVLVGVRYSYKNKELNYDKSTDHFIVIVGKSCEGSDIYYRYFEVGTYVVNKHTKGVNINNILILNKTNYVIEGDSPDSTKFYTITQIRKNKL